MVETLSAAIPDALERKIKRLLGEACRRDLKLVTAESCTGGLLASLLTDVEGCSHAYERGFVTYTEDAKAELLGVSREDLAEHGAVSETVARQMAEGALTRSKGDFALAITGFAGPGAEGDEPGLVHLGLARRGGPTRHQVARFGDVGRGPVRLAAVDAALGLLEEALADGSG